MNIRKAIFTIVEPKERYYLSKIYEAVMLSAIGISIIPLMFRQQNQLFINAEKIITAMFAVDYCLRWLTADFRMRRRGITPFLIYPFTAIAIIDLISILPAISFINNSLRVFRAWRLIRILRIAKIFKYYEPLQIVLEVFRKKSSLLFTVIGFAIFYIFVTALIMFNVEQEMDTPTNSHFFRNFFDALYWSTCTLTTVGYGDIYPTSTIGRFVCMLSSLVGMAIIALPSGIITAGYMEEVSERKRLKQQEKEEKEKKKKEEEKH